MPLNQLRQADTRRFILIRRFRRWLSLWIQLTSYPSMAVCLVSAILVSVNAILRKLSGSVISIGWTGELSAWSLLLIVMCGIPVLQLRDGHIASTVLPDLLPPVHHQRWMCIVQFLEGGTAILLAAGGLRAALHLYNTGAKTDLLILPKWPFALICAHSFFEFALLLFLDAADCTEPDSLER